MSVKLIDMDILGYWLYLYYLRNSETEHYNYYSFSPVING